MSDYTPRQSFNTRYEIGKTINHFVRVPQSSSFFLRDKVRNKRAFYWYAQNRLGARTKFQIMTVSVLVGAWWVFVAEDANCVPFTPVRCSLRRPRWNRNPQSFPFSGSRQPSDGNGAGFRVAAKYEPLLFLFLSLRFTTSGRKLKWKWTNFALRLDYSQGAHERDREGGSAIKPAEPFSKKTTFETCFWTSAAFHGKFFQLAKSASALKKMLRNLRITELIFCISFPKFYPLSFPPVSRLKYGIPHMQRWLFNGGKYKVVFVAV